MDERFTALKRYLVEMKQRQKALADDALFVLWLTHAHAAPDEDTARASLTGQAGDRGADSVYIDDRNGAVYIIQGKFRKDIETKTENAPYVRDFARLAEIVPDDPKNFPKYWKSLKGTARPKLVEANERLRRKDPYRLHLVYGTLGKFSEALTEEAKTEVDRLNPEATLSLLPGKSILAMWRDFELGVAPAVPVLELPIQGNAPLEREPAANGVEALVFSMQGREVARMYEQGSLQIFAKNVRGYMGEKAGSVNESMSSTLKDEPDNFWFFNNGVTIVCDQADYRGGGVNKRLLVRGAQIINGQQTTYTLKNTEELSPSAEVLIRLIKIPPSLDERELLISKIVRAANFQTPVSMADLKSNDSVQVQIERDLRGRGYWYLRKRYAPDVKGSLPGADLPWRFSKEELAKAVGGADSESLALRMGEKRLFSENEPHYEEIFSNGTDYLLSCWWLWKTVSSVAWGDSQKKWAKYVAHYFVWQQLKGPVMKRPRAFASAHESGDGEVMQPLRECIDIVLRIAIKGYVSYKKSGHADLEISPYFKGKEHQAFKNFEKEWKASPKLTARYKKNFSEFQAALESV